MNENETEPKGIRSAKAIRRNGQIVAIEIEIIGMSGKLYPFSCRLVNIGYDQIQFKVGRVNINKSLSVNQSGINIGSMKSLKLEKEDLDPNAWDN